MLHNWIKRIYKCKYECCEEIGSEGLEVRQYPLVPVFSAILDVWEQLEGP